MKILFDIGHPAHVHYFRNYLKEIPENRRLVIARNKEVTFQLLNSYNIKFLNRGMGGKGILRKILYMFYADIFILFHAIRFKPDLFISFSTVYPSHVAFILRKKYIGVTDTEHSVEQLGLFKPFSYKILTPSCFLTDLGPKQIRFPSYMELAYLHPKYFQPDTSVHKLLGCLPNESISIIRFVSWEASHDVNQQGLSYDYKKKLVLELSKQSRVFISSERQLDDDFEQYRLDIPAHKFHDVLSLATLYVGEGGTTASECAVLGVPNVYINSLKLGYCQEQEERYQLCYNFRTEAGVLEKCQEILADNSIREKFQQNRQKMLSEKISFTDFLRDFIDGLKMRQV